MSFDQVLINSKLKYNHFSIEFAYSPILLNKKAVFSVPLHRCGSLLPNIVLPVKNKTKITDDELLTLPRAKLSKAQKL
jgi:hypothetical protein